MRLRGFFFVAAVLVVTLLAAVNPHSALASVSQKNWPATRTAMIADRCVGGCQSLVQREQNGDVTSATFPVREGNLLTIRSVPQDLFIARIIPLRTE